MNSPLHIGHRGASGHAPENTLASIEKAIALGVDAVEIDVHRSRDGHLVVMHDDRVDRTTNGSGYICDLTLEQLRQLRTASNQSVPALEEVLELVRGRAALMVELKVRGIVADAIALLRSVCPGLPVFYASFLHSELVLARQLEPRAQTVALIDGVPVSPTTFAQDAQATHAGIAFSSLEPKFVNQLQGSGIRVFTFTVDDPHDIQYARSLGVDGLISNFPDRLSLPG